MREFRSLAFTSSYSVLRLRQKVSFSFPRWDMYRKGELMKDTENDFIMLPTVDVCFKKLMSNPAVRKGFISSLLGVDPETIRETTLLPTILPQDYPDDKLGILDVRIRMDDGRQIDMEMQVAYFEYWDERILFYLSKIFTDQLKKGDPYENLKQCIHVSILDFTRFEDDEQYFRTITFCDTKTGKEYTDLMKILILELPKLPESLKIGNNLVKWMRFLNGKSRREFKEMAKTDKYIGIAYEELEKLSADELEKLEYEAREKAIRDHNSQMGSALRRGFKQGIQRGIEQGIQQGIQRGIEEERASLIRNMLKNGVTPESISKMTGISLEAIEAVRQQNSAE